MIEKSVIVELKCCERLIRAHQSQLINYLKVSKIPIGLLVNFENRKLEYKRLYRPEDYEREEDVEEITPF